MSEGGSDEAIHASLFRMVRTRDAFSDNNDGVDSKAFFALFLQNTKEGYFSDPIYGGNKDMGAWKMIGFPGAHYDYKEWVPRHGERVPYPTVGFKGRPGWRQT